MARVAAWMLGFAAVGGLFILVFYRPYLGVSYRSKCKAHLRLIGLGLAAYRNDHNGELPPDLRMLLPNYVPDQANLSCPGSKNAFSYLCPRLSAGNLLMPRNVPMILCASAGSQRYVFGWSCGIQQTGQTGKKLT